MRANGESEIELVRRAATDLEAFGELVERYRDSIIGQCRSRIHDRHYAEDLAQETFVRAWLKLLQLRDSEQFPHWLRKIATNTCSEFLRGPARRELPWEALPDSIHAETAPGGLESISESLPEESLLCLRLFYEEQLSYREIGEITGLSAQSVRNRLHRAKALLREEMADMAPHKESAFTQRVLERLESLKSRSPEERVAAARELHSAMNRGRFDHIFHWLTQEDPMDRSFVIRKAGRVRSPRMRDALVEIVEKDDWEENRIKAAYALVAQGDPSVVARLRRALESPENSGDVRAGIRSAIAQLEKLKPMTYSGLDELRDDLKVTSHDRAARVELLRRLMSALKDPNAKVRNQAVKALGQLGDKRAAAHVARLLEDPSTGIRQAAAQVLGVLRSKQALPALIEVLRDSEDRRLLQPVILALGEIGDHRALPVLLDAMESRPAVWNHNLLVYTIRAVENLVTDEDLPRIKATIDKVTGTKDEVWDRYLDQLWIAALSRAGGSGWEEDIIAALEQEPGSIPLMQALARTGDPRAVDILRKSLTTGHANYRTALALISIGKTGVAAATEALRSPDPPVRAAVACAFADSDTADIPVDLLRNIAHNDSSTKAVFYAKLALYRLRKRQRRG